MLTFNADTVTNQPSANIDHTKPITLIQCIKLDQPHIVVGPPCHIRLRRKYSRIYRAPISIASWNKLRGVRKLDGTGKA